MKVEDKNSGIIAMNKLVFYALNYSLIPFTITEYGNGERTAYLPDLFQAFDGDMRSHLASKWLGIKGVCSRGLIIAFYTELDANNRQKMLDWILENYNDEQRISIH